jgi:hypothetical protein
MRQKYPRLPFTFPESYTLPNLLNFPALLSPHYVCSVTTGTAYHHEATQRMKSDFCDFD